MGSADGAHVRRCVSAGAQTLLVAMIKAITFDFWDTLAIDESDEPRRAAQGLPPKAEARLQSLTTEVLRHHPGLSARQVKAAFDLINDRFQLTWRSEQKTPTVSERLRQTYDYLGIPKTPGFDDVVREIEDMEVKIPPVFLPGVHQTLADLAKRYKLGMISDTIHTPGRGIRRLLHMEGLLEHFGHSVFSDEVGASKPAASVFLSASDGLGASPDEIVHVGDREHHDIEGALSVGMKAILFTGAVDRGSRGTRATAVCSHFDKLPAIVVRIASEKGRDR